MTETITPMIKMLHECGDDSEALGERISAVLEFLTLRAVTDTPYTIFTDDESAMVLIAANDDVKKIQAAFPKDVTIKQWDDDLDENDIEFVTNADPGDEQDTSDEPTPEQE